MTRRLALIFALFATAAVPAVAAAAPGRVTLVRAAGASGDLAWSRAHIWRMHGTTAWDPATTWVRRSAYALDSATAAAHPDWVLKDAFSTQLYVGSSLAGDFGNPAYRAWWIAQVTAQAAGAAGVYVDDVAMERRAYYEDGYSASIRDPRTGATMSEANWQHYMADFMTELRAALPAAEIVHDVVWYKGDARADIQRELSAATAVALETPSTAGSTGTYGWETFAGYVERREAAGLGVVLDAYADAPIARQYWLANALLLDTGALALGNDAWTAPNRFWTGYALNLGTPAGPRSSWSGVWRRDFAQGLVLVNPPGNGPRPVVVGSGYVDLDGVVQTQLTLAPGTAIVLRKAPTATAPPPPVAPVATPTPEPAPAPGKPGKRPGKAKAHSAGAATPLETRTTVSLARARVTGHVTGAVSGFARVTVQRKRGSGWVTVRRAKDSVSKRGNFAGDITPLARGTYRVMATFEGTGTARPSKSGYKVRSL
ncbi:putative glycoside hydrolase family 15 protein [Solirubrobacter ginsenosidimutans]|uniref:Glycoside hydrolase family 15 protein n=1 Tax=Solirubrobacter ginsenosidimutans TaxID=490573 RepID=A0A9X3MR21_9ACTN|nr:putative glycoside hydrolase [Solirubrobacter ginsenosidimutans]MDA0159590.1 putative glycoside hydrolase family 15 protein [Solirubrobacter ginsenosidimutans]